MNTITQIDIAYIPLTQGQLAKVDAPLAFIINQHKWHAWYDPKMKGFYARRQINNAPQSMHRFIWELCSSPIPKGMHIDHINGDTLNNTVNNLRLVTPRQNQQNKKTHRNGKLVGSYWRKDANKWVSSIYLSGNYYYLGYYDTEEEAHQTYIEALSNYELLDILPSKTNKTNKRTKNNL